MKVVKLNCKDFMTNGLEFVVQSETETHYIGAPNYHIPKVACTIIDTGEKPEQKGYCIKRTPEKPKEEVNVGEIISVHEEPYYRKMKVESGWMYNFFDVKKDNYSRVWIFVPEVIKEA